MSSLVIPSPARPSEAGRVDKLLLEVSARFIGLPADAVDGQVWDVQRRVCESLGLDRSTLWQQPPGNSDAFVLTHIYQPDDAPQPPESADARELFPWVLGQIRRGKTVALVHLEDLPPEARRDLETFRRFETKSTLVVPVCMAGKVAGALSFATVHEHRDWEPKVVQRLQLLAQVFADAIDRARSDRALRASEALLRKAADDWQATFDELKESRERFALAAAGANDGLWDWDLVKDRVYFSAQWKNILGYADDEGPSDRSSWESLIHPEDRGRVSSAIQAYLSGGAAAYDVELRLQHKDGSYRWVLSRGKALRDNRGRAYRIAGSHTDITARKQAEQQLRATLSEVSRLRDQLHQQNAYLRQEVKSLSRHARLVGQSEALHRVMAQVELVAPTNATVLLLGETGTGKELIASEIHELSPRHERVMVRVNCSAIPATLIESELFGREKGAYTGALSKQIGRFEMASGSTLFLDEVGELPMDMQVKLLRVLEQRQVERLGSPRSIPIDVRLIAATNQDLEKLIREGRFRQDLYYRLNVFPITMPPLRERLEDVVLLVSAFVSEFGAAFGKNIESIAPESIEALQGYNWPGNVRELRNVVERAMIVAKQPRLRIELPHFLPPVPSPSLSLHDAERTHILRVLELTAGRIRGEGGAASILKIKPTTLESRMAKLGIKPRGLKSRQKPPK